MRQAVSKNHLPHHAFNPRTQKGCDIVCGKLTTTYIFQSTHTFNRYKSKVCDTYTPIIPFTPQPFQSPRPFNEKTGQHNHENTTYISIPPPVGVRRDTQCSLSYYPRKLGSISTFILNHIGFPPVLSLFLLKSPTNRSVNGMFFPFAPYMMRVLSIS